MNKRLLLFFLLTLSFIISFAQENRLALVIGNSRYDEGSKFRQITNCANDAEDVSSKLKALGFDVIKYPNATYDEMRKAIDEFINKSSQYDVALFYYSGHGIQSDDINFLIPTNARNIKSESDLRDYSINANQLVRELEDVGCKLRIIVLDACRNNNLPGKSRESKNGLAEMTAPLGTIIAYATRPNETAIDGNGQRNSPYTKAFLSTLDIPNLNITEFFEEVGYSVVKSTEEQQIPVYEKTSSRSRQQFVFNRRIVSNKKSITFNLSPSNAKIKFGETAYKHDQFASFTIGDTYSYTVEADGYQSISGKISVSESTPSSLSVSLRKDITEKKKTIQFNFTPSHAIIKFGDVVCKNGQSLSFTYGNTYAYTIEAKGCQSTSGKISIDDSTPTLMSYELHVEEPAVVRIASNTFALVYLDDKYIGTTRDEFKTTTGPHKIKLTADKYYNEVFTLDVAAGNNSKYVYMTKKTPWFWDSDEDATFMLSYHYSPVYPISVSGMYQMDYYPFSLGMIIGSSVGFYRGWIPKIFTINEKQVYKYSKGLVNYSELYDPNHEAVKHNSEIIILVNTGYHVCNGIMLELGIGAAHYADKYYMNNAYYELEQNNVIGNTNLGTSIYTQTFFSQWYKGEQGTWSYAGRIGAKANIPLDSWAFNMLSIGGGCIFTPNLKTKCTWDISISYKYAF